jgi:integrase
VWLRWGNVDLERRVVHVVEFVSGRGYNLVASSGRAATPFGASSWTTGWCASSGPNASCTAEERLTAANYVESEFVFTRPAGGPYHPVKMLANGVPPKVAAERLGHADATLFTNLYSHVAPTMQREAADKIGAALFD